MNCVDTGTLGDVIKLQIKGIMFLQGNILESFCAVGLEQIPSKIALLLLTTL